AGVDRTDAGVPEIGAGDPGVYCSCTCAERMLASLAGVDRTDAGVPEIGAGDPGVYCSCTCAERMLAS
ncbi:hypothetical protein C7E18_24595, partial [Stenotrophomonas maltophilia]